jgi:DME family drug/metabolite transporter
MRWNVAVAALAASWGFISVIVAAVDLDAAVLVFFRLALAAAAIGLVLAVAGRGRLLAPPAAPWRLAVVGAVLAAHWYLFFEAIKLTSVAVAILVVYTGPIFVAAIAPLFLTERWSLVALAAFGPAGAGLALIALAGREETRVTAPGLAAGVGAAVTYAALVIATKRLTQTVGTPAITFWMYAVAALCLAPFLVAADRVRPEGDELAYVLLLGLVFTALSGSLFVMLLRRVTAQAVGLLGYVEPVSASLLAWAILDEPLGPAVLVGGALIVLAGAAVVFAAPVDAPPARPA